MARYKPIRVIVFVTAAGNIVCSINFTSVRWSSAVYPSWAMFFRFAKLPKAGRVLVQAYLPEPRTVLVAKRPTRLNGAQRTDLGS